MLAYPVMQLVVRHPTPTEILPDWSLDGQQFPQLDPSWVWIATQDWYTLGVLIAAPCHGIAHMIRLVTRTDAPQSTVTDLLRAASAEVRQRGFNYFMVTADPLRATESRLLDIARRLGAVESGNPHVLAIGKIPESL